MTASGLATVILSAAPFTARVVPGHNRFQSPALQGQPRTLQPFRP